MECCKAVQVPSDKIFVCCVCARKYHYECLNLTPSQYATLSMEYMNSWKCPSCSNVTKRNKPNTGTPVRKSHLPVYDDSMNMSCDNLDNPTLSTSRENHSNRKGHDSSMDFEAFSANLYDTLSRWRCEMRKDMSIMKDDIIDTLSSIQNEIGTMRAEYIQLKQDVASLREEVQGIQAQHLVERQEALEVRIEDIVGKCSPDSDSKLSEIFAKIDVLEQQARSCNLEICNVPDKRNESLPTLIEKIGNVLKCPVRGSEVISIHRVPHAERDNPRPKNIIVKFSTRLQRDNLLSAFRKAKKLSTDQIGHVLAVGGDRSSTWKRRDC
ncbi:hypothetical protein ACJJTC_015646 [Scirpophaga incertulas]